MDSIDAVRLGYKTLKIKVGVDANKDIERMKAIRQAVGFERINGVKWFE